LSGMPCSPPFGFVGEDVLSGGLGEGNGASFGDGRLLGCLLFGKLTGLVPLAAFGDRIKPVLLAQAASLFAKAAGLRKGYRRVGAKPQASVLPLHATAVLPILGDLPGWRAGDLHIEPTTSCSHTAL
jgi:hypothetical protein